MRQNLSFDLNEAKKKVSKLLMNVPDISGVGLHEGVLIVYLARDSDTVRRRAQEIINQAAPGVVFEYLVTGKFRKY
jgi:hypothetical protein